MRALVLSGGGSRGAFQIGALQYLEREAKDYYQVFCGVSVGALNCAGLAQYDNFSEGVDYVSDLWHRLTDKDVKKHWFPFGYLHGLWKTGLYNTSPLRKMIYEVFDAQKVIDANNILRVGAVNLQTNQYNVFTEQDCLAYQAAPILASSSFPVMFEAVKLQGHLWTDGGARTITPLKAAIDIPEVTEIDVILASKIPGPSNHKRPKNVIDVASRALEAALDEIFINDLKIAQLYNELAKADLTNKRYVKIRTIQPEGPLPGDSLTFHPEHIERMIDLGYFAASKQVK